jgi:hypothetical protein
LSAECTAVENGFAASFLRALVAGPAAETGADQIVCCVDVEFAEEEAGCPGGVLNVDYAEGGLGAEILFAVEMA